MKKIQISPRDLVTLCVLALGLIVFIFLAVNQWMQFTKAVEDLKLEEERSELLSQDKEYLQQLMEKEDVLLERMAYLEKMMPGDKGTIKLIDYLNELLVIGNFHALQLDTLELVEAEGYYAVPVKIVFEGEYERIMLFLKELRYGSRPIKIVEFILSRNDAQPSRVQCEVLAHGFMDGIEK
jgi:Tfp pilus assembly protein PilO